MSKANKPNFTIKTREELEETMNNYAAFDAVLRRTRAQLDVELAKIRERFAPLIAQCEAEQEPFAELLAEWAALNPAEFSDKKSVELVAGRIGFRITPPSVKTMKGVREETAITRVLESQFAAGWTRNSVELARDVILADYAAEKATDADLKDVGLRIQQTENFYIEPFETKGGEA